MSMLLSPLLKLKMMFMLQFLKRRRYPNSRSGRRQSPRRRHGGAAASMLTRWMPNRSIVHMCTNCTHVRVVTGRVLVRRTMIGWCKEQMTQTALLYKLYVGVRVHSWYTCLFEHVSACLIVSMRPWNNCSLMYATVFFDMHPQLVFTCAWICTCFLVDPELLFCIQFTIFRIGMFTLSQTCSCSCVRVYNWDQMHYANITKPARTTSKRMWSFWFVSLPSAHWDSFW